MLSCRSGACCSRTCCSSSSIWPLLLHTLLWLCSPYPHPWLCLQHLLLSASPLFWREAWEEVEGAAVPPAVWPEKMQNKTRTFKAAQQQQQLCQVWCCTGRERLDRSLLAAVTTHCACDWQIWLLPAPQGSDSQQRGGYCGMVSAYMAPAHQPIPSFASCHLRFVGV